MRVASVETIERGMDGHLREVEPGRSEALLPSPCVQNHAAFLFRHESGGLACLWFGGSLEGKADISIWRSALEGAWQPPERLSDDPERSEQNPVAFTAPDGRGLVLHTAQPGGDQDACVVRMREHGAPPRDLPLATGTFIRDRIHLRSDGAWLLPVYRCVPQPGRRWTGALDVAGVAISPDGGASWYEVGIPGSVGCVHTTLVPLGGDRYAAFFRRRQADWVHRSVSADGGETWSPPEPTDVPNNNSSIAVIRRASGDIVMACNPVNATMHPSARRTSLYDEIGADDRPAATGGCEPIWGVPRAPMTLAFSDDDGRTFPRRIVVDDGPGTCLTNDSRDGRNHELSYPSLLQGPDGTLDLAYTYHRRAIKHVRLLPDWLAAR